MRKEARAKERRRTLIVVAVCVAVAARHHRRRRRCRSDQDNQAKDELAKQSLTDIGTAASRGRLHGHPGDGRDRPGPAHHGAGDLRDHARRPSVRTTRRPTSPASTSTPPTTGRPSRCWCTTSSTAGRSSGTTTRVAGNDAQMNVLKATADKFDSMGNAFSGHMIIAPWTKDDQGGGADPGRQAHRLHALVDPPARRSTRQTASRQDPSFGESQYCGSFSGARSDDFMKKFPYDDAPEGSIWHQ